MTFVVASLCQSDCNTLTALSIMFMVICSHPFREECQRKTGVALVQGLNLTFHNIELNTIMQNMFIHAKMGKIFVIK